MSSKFCDNCGHEKRWHVKGFFGCRQDKCKCDKFIRGPQRDGWGNIEK